MSLKPNKALFIMSLKNPHVTTRAYPETFTFLKQNFAPVLETKCFNAQHLPFTQEVKDTEIGHLFEHLLLSFLTLHKRAAGEKNTLFRGVTSWDWTKEPFGTFHITIYLDTADQKYVKGALSQSIILTRLLLANHQQRMVN